MGEEDQGEVKGEDPLKCLKAGSEVNNWARETQKKKRDWLSLQEQVFRFPRRTHIPHIPPHVYTPLNLKHHHISHTTVAVVVAVAVEV